MCRDFYVARAKNVKIFLFSLFYFRRSVNISKTMDKIFQNPVQLAKGVNLKNLLSSDAEFQIDLDFKQTPSGLDLMTEDNILNADDESDSEEDVYKHLEEKTEKMMLASPEYLSFEELEKKMIECRGLNIPSGAVKIHIMEEGNGPLVAPDAEVTIHYAAYWEKGKIPFDSTLTMNCGVPMRLRLGAGKFLPGLEIALTNVKGPTCRFLALLRPEVAWGPLGVPPRILPQSALFVVALYAVHEVDLMHRFNDLPSEEQSKFETTLRTVQAIRNHGKDLFSRKRYHQAIKDYQQAINVLTISRPENEAQEKELKDLKVKIFLNLAICYYKLDKPKYILNMLDNIDKIVDVETLPKALFYYGRAYEMLSQTEKAIKYFKKALKLEPKNKEIGNTLLQLDKQNKQSAPNEQMMWQKAFNSVPTEKKVTYAVDEDFENGVREMCKDLAERDEYSKFDLPVGLSNDEVLCIQTLASRFDKLIVAEDGTGKKRRITIIKKP